MGWTDTQNRVELHIRSIAEVAELMLVISEQGLTFSDDDGCLLLNGLVRECAYKIRDAAELERKVHLERGQRDGAPG